jgi:hypothetical protein
VTAEAAITIARRQSLDDSAEALAQRREASELQLGRSGPCGPAPRALRSCAPASCALTNATFDQLDRDSVIGPRLAPHRSRRKAQRGRPGTIVDGHRCRGGSRVSRAGEGSRTGGFSRGDQVVEMALERPPTSEAGGRHRARPRAGRDRDCAPGERARGPSSARHREGARRHRRRGQPARRTRSRQLRGRAAGSPRHADGRSGERRRNEQPRGPGQHRGGAGRSGEQAQVAGADARGAEARHLHAEVVTPAVQMVESWLRGRTGASRCPSASRGRSPACPG